MDFAKPPTDFIDAGGVRLAYRKLGRGPDVLFLHGWPLHGATFRHIAPALARDVTCHVIDLPGAGGSDLSEDNDLGAHAAIVRRAVDALGLARYAIVAHDSGGLTARHLAAADERVAGLVLADTEIPGHHSLLLGAFVIAARVWPGMLPAVLRSPRLRRSTLGFGTCFSDPRYVDGEFFELLVRPLLESPRLAASQVALLRNLKPALVDGLADVHAKLRVPVQLVWGTRDPFFPVAKARRMRASFGAGAELHEIPGARLFPHEDHPDEVVAVARPFLARCFAERAARAS